MESCVPSTFSWNLFEQVTFYNVNVGKLISDMTKKIYPTMFKTIITLPPNYYDQSDAFSKNASESFDRAVNLQRSMAKLNEATSYRIFEKLTMIRVYHSNAIEGSQLSLQDTVAFLQDDIINEQKPVLDHLDALGHAAAIGLVGSTLRQGEKVDQNFVCEVNDLLTKHVTTTTSPTTEEVTTSGIYKQTYNSIEFVTGQVHDTVDPGNVPHEMEELFDFCEHSTAHPIVKAAIAHFNFIRIHPFEHGNGRGARILMNLILQHHGLPPAVIKVEDKDQYLNCLHLAENGDIVPFIEFVASSLVQTMEFILETAGHTAEIAVKNTV